MEEKTTHECKNCSEESEGQFCSFCGQRYHAHKESFGELVYEFVSDFLHFDSRFFKTVFPLLFSPGKLTKSYNAGKQRSQFHPIRLYLFSSFVYFFLFFYFNNVEEQFENENNTANSDTAIIDSIKHDIQHGTTGKAFNDINDSSVINKVLSDTPNSKLLSDKKEYIALQDTERQIAFTVTPYIDSLLKKNVTPKEYIKLQQSMSKEKRAGFFERIITQRLLKINLEGEAGKKEFFKKLIATFSHNIPKMLFFLLPVFALLLKLLYIRRKQFYYVDHAVLSLHYFSFMFLMLILGNYILNKIFGTDLFTALSLLWITLYLLIAMKRLYMQSWIKTLGKFIALGFLFLITILFSLMVNLAWSAFMI